MARDCVKKVEYLLSENVPVLVCSGQLDLIVDTPGTMMWVDNLNFPQSEEFRASDFTLWKVNGAMAGYT